MPDTLALIKLSSIILILLIALAAGLYPFYSKWSKGISHFPTGQALASGIFLGVGLIHMLGDASSDFTALHYTYPLAFLISGIVFLAFLGLEHLAHVYYKHKANSNTGFAVIAFIMLSIHSLFTGAALGLSDHLAVIIVLLAAILAHKWAASFVLAMQLAKSCLGKKSGIILFVIFALMTPIGIYAGNLISTTLNHNAIIVPIFNSIAAGTFLYLGTLHGLSRSFMINECCSLKSYCFVIAGFALMAVVAIWV